MNPIIYLPEETQDTTYQIPLFIFTASDSDQQ